MVKKWCRSVSYTRKRLSRTGNVFSSHLAMRYRDFSVMFGMTGQSQALYNAPGMYCYWFLSNQRERDRPTMAEHWKTHGTWLILIGCVYFTARDTRITYT